MGGEKIKFRSGQDCGDSFVSEEVLQELTNDWKKYAIEINGKNLNNIRGAF